MKRFKALLPLFLSILIVAGGFFGPAVVSRLLPDYTGQVFGGYKEESIQNIFTLGAGEKLLVYPWDVFERSSCITLQAALAEPADSPGWPEGLHELVSALPVFLKKFNLPPDFPVDWEDEILVDVRTGMVYLPEIRIPEQDSFSAAVSPSRVCYVHQIPPIPGTPADHPDELLRGYIEDARRQRAEGTAASEPAESSQPDNEWDPGLPPHNPVLSFMDSAYTMYNYTESDLPYRFSDAQDTVSRMKELFLYADYTTLSQDGETLISFYRVRQGETESLVLYYEEDYDVIAGFSLKLNS